MFKIIFKTAFHGWKPKYKLHTGRIFDTVSDPIVERLSKCFLEIPDEGSWLPKAARAEFFIAVANKCERPYMGFPYLIPASIDCSFLGDAGATRSSIKEGTTRKYPFPKVFGPRYCTVEQQIEVLKRIYKQWKL